MLSKGQCDTIDFYLVPIFEFIVTQYMLKAGLEKAKQENSKELERLIVQNGMMQYTLNAGLRKFGEKVEGGHHQGIRAAT